MSREAYELAEAFNKKKRINSGVELAAVVAVEPLTIQIGEATYSRDNWVFYEAETAIKELEIKHLSGGTSKEKELKAKMLYKVGDLLAVQQMEGDKRFLIMAKVRRI